MVTWTNPYNTQKSNNSGLVILKNIAVHDKVHLADPRGKAHVEVSYPVGLGVSVHSKQSECGG